MRRLAVAIIMVGTTLCTLATAQPTGVPDLLNSLKSEDQAVRAKAFDDLVAMGDTGVQAVLSALVEPGQGDDAGARFALHGLAMLCGRPSAETAKREALVALCAKYLESEAPAATKQFVISQLQVCGQKEAAPALAACLTNEALVEYASRALAVNPSAEALKALRDALPKAPPAGKVSIIQALGQRRDGAATALLIAEAKSADPQVALAAAAALGRIGDPKAEPALAALLTTADERGRRAAFQAYMDLGDQLAEADKMAEAMKVYGSALKAARGEAEKCAALGGFGRAGTARDVAAIMASLADPSPAVRAVAQRCLVELPDPKTVDAIVEAMKKGQPAERAGLLRVLSARKEEAAAKAISDATKDPSAEVRVVAFQLLGQLSDPAMEKTLLEAAETGSEAIKPVALDSYIRLADARRGADREAALAMYRRALDIATTDGLRRMALNGLAAVAGEESLAKVEPLLANDALRNDALRAYVGIAGRTADAGQKQRGIDMLTKAVEMGPSRDVAGAAVAKLRELGVNIDPAKAAGFVTTWWLMGPFPGPEIDKKWAPEDGVDLAAKVTVDNRDLTWTKHHTTDVSGTVNFDALMNPNDNVTGYMYAEVTVDRDRDVLLKTGSDDCEKILLNGTEIYKFPSPRSLVVDQDTVKAHLVAGVNKILVKVGEWGGGWEACLRVTDPDGKPVPFQQRED
jgi:HEAT repeat protein